MLTNDGCIKNTNIDLELTKGLAHKVHAIHCFSFLRFFLHLQITSFLLLLFAWRLGVAAAATLSRSPLLFLYDVFCYCTVTSKPPYYTIFWVQAFCKLVLYPDKLEI